MTPEDVIARDAIPSPGGWTVPAGEVAGKTWTPNRSHAAPERMPLWVRVWFHTPIIDRFAGAWMWPRGGYLVLPPDHSFFREFGPDEYQAVSGMSPAEYERELLADVQRELRRELDAQVVTIERVTLEGEGIDARIVVLFRLADQPDRLFGDSVKVWPSPHPDDYEGGPDWGWVVPHGISDAIADPARLAGMPDAHGITWINSPPTGDARP